MQLGLLLFPGDKAAEEGAYFDPLQATPHALELPLKTGHQDLHIVDATLRRGWAGPSAAQIAREFDVVDELAGHCSHAFAKTNRRHVRLERSTSVASSSLSPKITASTRFASNWPRCSTQVDQLSARVGELLHQLCGRKSERVNPNQLKLALAQFDRVPETDKRV